MKYVLSLAAMCLFLFVGSVLPVSSQATSDAPFRTLSCWNGECLTTVAETGGGWTMLIWCEGMGDEQHEYSGTGSYGGSVCGMTME